MPTFRAYLLNPAGRITWGEWIEAADQQEAEAAAARLCDGGHPKVELWRGRERLAELPCESSDPGKTGD
jgi:hypothetical protein